MIYTFIKIEEWCGLWKTDANGSELLYEHHDLTIPQLHDYTKDSAFELEVHNYPDGVEGIFMDIGEFAARPLTFWRGWAEEPERMRREHGSG